jgi:hypothetical protein
LASGLGQVSDLKRRLTMIMRGSTPRALSWPGCLTVLAVGAFFLPLLPALHAQAPGKEAPREDVIVIQVDEEAQVADLDKASADLAQQEAQLKKQMAAVEQAKANLEIAKARLRESQAKLEAVRRGQVKARIDKEIILEHKLGVIVGDKVKNPAGAGEGQRKGSIRIEIIASPEMKSDELKELLKKLESVLPKEHAAIHLRVAEEATNNQLRIHTAAPVIRYVPQIQIGSDKDKAATAEKKPAGSTQEKRINELEMKLEKVLKELHELRKQMKDSQSGQAPAPSAHTIPAPRGDLPLYRIVPRSEVRPGAKNPRPVPPPPVDPYDAPTVPLAPEKPSGP